MLGNVNTGGGGVLPGDVLFGKDFGKSPTTTTVKDASGVLWVLNGGKLSDDRYVGYRNGEYAIYNPKTLEKVKPLSLDINYGGEYERSGEFFLGVLNRNFHYVIYREGVNYLIKMEYVIKNIDTGKVVKRQNITDQFQDHQHEDEVATRIITGMAMNNKYIYASMATLIRDKLGNFDPYIQKNYLHKYSLEDFEFIKKYPTKVGRDNHKILILATDNELYLSDYVSFFDGSTSVSYDSVFMYRENDLTLLRKEDVILSGFDTLLIPGEPSKFNWRKIDSAEPVHFGTRVLTAQNGATINYGNIWSYKIPSIEDVPRERMIVYDMYVDERNRVIFSYAYRGIYGIYDWGQPDSKHVAGSRTIALDYMNQHVPEFDIRPWWER